MAKEVGLPLHIIKGAYYLPLMETHPKVNAIIDRMQALGKGVPSYDVDGISLMIAHGLILAVMETLHEHFKIEEMRELIDKAKSDFHRAWKDKGKG